MDDKELVSRFFTEGYEHQNFDFILECLAEDYLDHSPAGARSNRDAVGILKAVSGTFGDMRVSMEDIFSESGMVGTRVRYEAVHIGEWMGIAATGRRSPLKLWRISRWLTGKLWNPGGIGPTKKSNVC